MSGHTRPVFIVGTGRSGTRTLSRMLAGASGIEIHHEYAVLETQRLASLYFMGRITASAVKRRIARMHGAAIYYSEADTWIDSSNKLSWIIEPIAEQFPQSRFLAIIRDGRKVVSSFYYKLREEMYDDQSTHSLMQWLANPDRSIPCPPPEKRFWWNIPQRGQPWHAEFPAFDRLQRVAYHWSECNRVILESFSRLSPQRVKVVKLEALRRDAALLDETLDFLGVRMDDIYMSYLQTPRNVLFPLDFQLTHQQLDAFEAICGPMMRTLGYYQEEVYSVKY